MIKNISNEESSTILGVLDAFEDLLETLPDQGRVLCKKCGKTYSTMTNARRHISDAHMPQQNARCQLCNRTFRNKRYRNDHYRSFHGISLHEMNPLL